MVGSVKRLDTNAFWDTDICDIESQFLKGRSVSTLPTHLDERVPSSSLIIPNRVAQPKHNLFGLIKNIFKIIVDKVYGVY